ncbi:MAG: hypothetical protein IJA63_00100 [Akkermansia sp.]|nr:hypothetical protein [Akkermansia sp.]
MNLRPFVCSALAALPILATPLVYGVDAIGNDRAYTEIQPCSDVALSASTSLSAFIQRITNLPDYRVYEESKDQFIERLHQGDYWNETEGTDTVEYLHIGGDGCWGCRLFMLVNQADLFVLIEDWEGDPRPTEDYVLRYNPRENDLETFCYVPKSILGEDDTSRSRPERAWFRLQEHRAGNATSPQKCHD